MPQFDFFSFFVQIFWLSISSCLFYLIYLKMPINHSSQVIKMRNKLKNFASQSSLKTKNNFIYNSVVSFF
jgi:hypothetical protein